MLTERATKIVENVLKMNDKQLSEFLKGLTPEYKEYLDVIIEKYQKDLE